jgi:hypothetical protein
MAYPLDEPFETPSWQFSAETYLGCADNCEEAGLHDTAALLTEAAALRREVERLAEHITDLRAWFAMVESNQE